MKRPLWIFGLVMILCFGLGNADIYKWVDENGVVHYTDEPPENQPVTEVEINAPPTAEQRAEAEAIYRQDEEQAQASNSEGAQSKTKLQETGQRQPLEMTADRMRCFEAFTASGDLERRGDVYEDEAGKIHHWDSLHSFWYESYRKRLSDSDKRDRIKLLEDEMERYCDVPMKEVRKRAGAWEKEQSVSQCHRAKQKLERIHGDNSKTPRGTIEDIEKLISENCG